MIRQILIRNSRAERLSLSTCRSSRPLRVDSLLAGRRETE